MNRDNRGNAGKCNNNGKQLYWQIPRGSKIPRKQLDIQETTESNSYASTDYKTGNRISEGFCGNHLCKLIAVHTNRPHSTILFCPGCYAHGNAVHNVEQGNHGNNRQETIYNKNGCQIGCTVLPVAFTLIRKNNIAFSKVTDLLYSIIRSIFAQLHSDHAVILFSCKPGEGFL